MFNLAPLKQVIARYVSPMTSYGCARVQMPAASLSSQ
jgi:hypothetical protein